MSSIGNNLNTKDIQYFKEMRVPRSLRQKTTDVKRVNKFRYSNSLDNLLKRLMKQFIKILGAVVITLFMFTVIYYSSVEFINMKYGSSYEEMYDKPDSGAAKLRSIPNIREQVRIKAEREMIMNKIHDALEHLE